jgi:uncharacterized repeat protein (TIGR03803 family)
MKSISRFVLVSAISLLSTSTLLFAGTEKVLFNDTESLGYPPTNGLIFDSAGNLYGSSFNGASEACGNGQGGCGAVFKLSPQGNGTWVFTDIYEFTGGSDGLHPDTNLVFDAAGNLYGATYGSNPLAPGDPAAAKSYGTVFKLSPNASGPWNFTLLYTFTGGSGGLEPNSIAIDSSGNLYGTTPNGGSANQGFVFQLTPTESGPWNENIIHDFTGCEDGGLPVQVTFDPKGNLYGAASFGGAAACAKPGGVVFQLTQSGGVWQETEIYSFDAGTDGGYPATLVFDSAGHIYGTADIGGKNDHGLVFKLTQSNGQWSETDLHSFNGQDGFEPQSLVLGSGGVLFGTVEYDGQSEAGLMYELTPQTGTKETIVYQFGASPNDAAHPRGPITLDNAGNIYGGTLEGGLHEVGTIFEVTP